MLQTYRRQPVTFVRGEGVRLYDADGREYLDLLSGIGVASLGHAHPRPGARDRRSGADAAPHLEPVLSPAAGPAGRAAGAPVRAAARVLLQQRHRSGRGVPEVRAPLLVHAAASRAREIIALEESFHGRTFGALSVTSDEHYRAPFEPLLAGRHGSCRPTIRRRCWPPCRRTTAAIIVEPIQGEGGVRPLTPAFAAAINEACAPHRRAAHRRRSAERARPHRLSVLLRRHRPQAAPGVARQGARRRRAGRRRAGQRRGGGRDLASAITAAPTAATCWRAAPRLCVLDELVDGGLLAHIGRVGRHFEQRLQRHGRGASDRQGSPRRRPDVGARAAPRRGTGRAGRAWRTAWSSIAPRKRSCGCCRRWSSPSSEVDEGLTRLDAALAPGRSGRSRSMTMDRRRPCAAAPRRPMTLGATGSGVTTPQGFRAAGDRRRDQASQPDRDATGTPRSTWRCSSRTCRRRRRRSSPPTGRRRRRCSSRASISRDRAASPARSSSTAAAPTPAPATTACAVARDMAAETARLVGCPVEQVLVASTGVIGVALQPRQDPRAACRRRSQALAADQGAARRARDHDDRSVSEGSGGSGVDRRPRRRASAAWPRAPGMIEPMMATMLGFVTTDAAVPQPLLDRALREVVDDTFNAITVDGECSTNDCVMLLANGASGVTDRRGDLRRVRRRRCETVCLRAGARHRARRRRRDQARHRHGHRRRVGREDAPARRQGDRQLAAGEDRDPRRRSQLGPADCRRRPRRRRLRAVARRGHDRLDRAVRGRPAATTRPRREAAEYLQATDIDVVGRPRRGHARRRRSGPAT